MRADIYFSDADGVKPNDVTIGETLFEFAGIITEALSETTLPVSAPPHFEKIKRRAEKEADCEEEVVKSAHQYLFIIRYTTYKGSRDFSVLSSADVKCASDRRTWSFIAGRFQFTNVQNLITQFAEMAEVAKKSKTRWRRVATDAVVLSTMWLLLSGLFDLFHLSLGAISVILVLLINRREEMKEVDRFPIKLTRLLIYLAWLAKEMILSAVHVARVVIAPRMPLDPVLIRFKSKQPNDLARVLLANSITLTPGTLTIDLSGDDFLVHSLTRNTADGVTNGVMQEKVARMFVNEPGVFISDVEYNPELRRS